MEIVIVGGVGLLFMGALCAALFWLHAIFVIDPFSYRRKLQKGRNALMQMSMRLMQTQKMIEAKNQRLELLSSEISSANQNLSHLNELKTKFFHIVTHEIRNPLAAIAQANSLLAEDAASATQQQLTRMVADNVQRLTRIVDDVMEVAPGAVIEAGVIDVTAEVGAICSDWAGAAGLELGNGSLFKIELPQEPLGATFDVEHLRRVLINLLDNARRHATGAPGSVRLRLMALDEATVQLSISSDGATIPDDVERYLFEPFFSTRSRGTGLGLYICRQLCEQYGASIDYRVRPAAEANRNDFVVNMRRRSGLTAEAGLQFPI